MIVEGERLLLLERIEGGSEQFLGEVVQGGQAAICLLQRLLVAPLLQCLSRPPQLRTLGVDVHLQTFKEEGLGLGLAERLGHGAVHQLVRLLVKLLGGVEAMLEPPLLRVLLGAGDHVPHLRRDG